MPSQYLQIPSDLSQQDSHGNESFTDAYSFPPYPLTPYPTIPETKDWSPFALETRDNLVHTTEPEAERRVRTHFYASSPSDLCHSSPTSSLKISSTELQRVLDSLLDQVDWLEVAVRVAEHRAPSIYCNAIEKILLAHIHRLVKTEGEGEDAANFSNGSDDEEYVYVYESDDEDEVRSEAPRESEDEDGDGDEDGDEDMEGDEDEQDDEDSDDGMDDDEYDEDNVYDSI